MQIVVISDSHGHGTVVDKIIRKESAAEIVVFLGDVVGDIEDLQYEYTDKKFVIVSGNGDFFSTAPYTSVFKVGDIGVFATHGHTLRVNYGPGELIKAAKQSDCKVALYGHTHVPYIGYEDGVHIVNPGSCSRTRDGKSNSYAVIDIRDNGILPNIIRI